MSDDKRDAARYRWLRNKWPFNGSLAVVDRNHPSGGEAYVTEDALDWAVDAEMLDAVARDACGQELPKRPWRGLLCDIIGHRWELFNWVIGEDRIICKVGCGRCLAVIAVDGPKAW